MFKAWHKNLVLHFFRFKILSSIAHVWYFNEHKYFSSCLVRILCLVDCASRYIRVKKNQLDAQFIFSIFRQTSTCFGRNYCPSSGGTPYAYNWYLLFYLDDCLLSCQDSRQSSTCLKHVEVWRNMQLINLHVSTTVLFILYKVRLHVSTIHVVILRCLISFKS